MDAANPQLVVKGFEAWTWKVDLGSPPGSTNTNAAFTPGAILPGVAFANDPDNALSRVVGLDLPGLTGKTPIKRTEWLGKQGPRGKSLSIGTFVVGLDLYPTTGGNTVLITAAFVLRRWSSHASPHRHR